MSTTTTTVDTTVPSVTAAIPAAQNATTAATELTLELATKNWNDFKIKRISLGPFQDPDFVTKVLMKNLAFAALALASFLVMAYYSGLLRMVSFSIMVCTLAIIGTNVYAYVEDLNLKKMYKDKKIEDIKKLFPDVVPKDFENVYSPL